MKEDQKLEEQLSRALTEGEMERNDPKRAAIRQLPTKYETRTQAAFDPIVEETKRFRGMAKEIDDRYDRYMKREASDEEHTPQP
ncbi:hypothetical protein [Marinicrinis lubricantis]|uniref:Uncharacterized protein n=1 Tax=Marinicrinis lubricantis TaxID=2086470 RepID=A0ABW1IJ71_9BACL